MATPKLDLHSFAKFLYNLAAVHSQQPQIKFGLQDVEILYNLNERCVDCPPLEEFAKLTALPTHAATCAVTYLPIVTGFRTHFWSMTHFVE